MFLRLKLPVLLSCYDNDVVRGHRYATRARAVILEVEVGDPGTGAVDLVNHGAPAGI